MKKIILMAAASAMLVLPSCQNDVDDMMADRPQPAEQTTTDNVLTRALTSTTPIEDHCISFDSSFDVTMGPYYDGLSYRKSCTEGRQITEKNAIEAHFEVLPIYVFGNQKGEGDYYAVNGYLIAHNAPFWQHSYKDESCFGGYCNNYNFMHQLAFTCQLLDQDNNLIASNDNPLAFAQYPSPETTVETDNYQCGWNLSFSAKVCVGAKLIGVGIWPELGFSFSCNDKVTRSLPDQSVILNTQPDGTVDYNFCTNNYELIEESPSLIPTFAHSDQRVYFSWIWYVPRGRAYANDNDTRQLRMKFDLHPSYLANSWGEISTGSQVAYFSDFLQEIPGTQSVAYFDLPAPDRTPAGDICFQNTTRSYIKDFCIYEAGAYAKGQQPIRKFSGALNPQSKTPILLHEGQYDLVYTLVNGTTNVKIGDFIVKDVDILPNETLNLSTLDSEQL